jgi:hypothetical protein
MATVRHQCGQSQPPADVEHREHGEGEEHECKIVYIHYASLPPTCGRVQEFSPEPASNSLLICVPQIMVLETSGPAFAPSRSV